MYVIILCIQECLNWGSQFKEATENSLNVLNDPQSSWKYVEIMYYVYDYTVKSTLLKSILSGSNADIHSDRQRQNI